ncbi:hypothetical protein HDF16_000555 [Granulicella aggregans]|uniref:DUF1223 domain-containing protein n=1 Tax=Granulicella aggregans TaxID=474949 RepID=A0A7W7ZAP3_9BACT|nr:DUF1223 domain-containing protein [Granulicella aggregans]MBB5055886.1 hypothetical protein [Granulicella aggregans]
MHLFPIKSAAALLVLAFTGTIVSQAQAPAAKPAVVLVELFTSEGCSSCPPADALLRQIDHTQTAAGQLIVGISEHVTYWNSLGWQDPFSSSIYTDRQNSYGRRFNLDSVYTPQMVVNGSEQFVGSDKGGLVRAVKEQIGRSESVALNISSVSRSGNSLSVSFSANGAIPSTGVDIIAVVADDSDQSSVQRGENSGRTLTHVSVARSLTRVATLKSAEEKTVSVAIPASFQPTQHHHLILFAQASGYGSVLGADSKPL